MLPLISDTTVTTSTPDFGVFSQLSNYGPLGLVVLALGYVAWIFIQRHLAEKDRLKQEAKPKKRTSKTK
jgi:hypothetical protein